MCGFQSVGKELIQDPLDSNHNIAELVETMLEGTEGEATTSWTLSLPGGDMGITSS